MVGFNYRMTEFRQPSDASSSSGYQISYLAVAPRRPYAEVLGGIEGLNLPVEPEWARSNWQSYCVRLPDRVDQKAVMQGSWTKASRRDEG